MRREQSQDARQLLPAPRVSGRHEVVTACRQFKGDHAAMVRIGAAGHVPGGHHPVGQPGDGRRVKAERPRCPTGRGRPKVGQHRQQPELRWLGVLGKWETATPPLGAEHVTIAVSGARGGHTVDFRTLAASGIKLTGRAVSYDNGTMRFAPDLGENIAHGDAKTSPGPELPRSSGRPVSPPTTAG